jgi:hypothetical protein
MRITQRIGALIVAGGLLISLFGCTSETPSGTDQHTSDQTNDQHTAYHGGCLNVIETCELGHAEVRISGDQLQLWFVGGENETKRAVRISARQVVLAITPENGGQKNLTLMAKPIVLAEESVGDCSYFEGSADWLTGVKQFTASGTVELKGRPRSIRISYPDGYDPEEDHGHTGGHGK